MRHARRRNGAPSEQPPAKPLPLACQVAALTQRNPFRALPDPKRGYDHGAFVPLQVAFPEADVPATQLSLLRSLSPAAHIAMGRALAPLRDEGVLIVGSGMTFHNMQGLMSCLFGGDDVAAMRSKSDAFDAWLSDTLGVGAAASNATAEERLQRLQRWADAPHGAWHVQIALPFAPFAIHADCGAPCATQRASATRERSICCRCSSPPPRRKARPRRRLTLRRLATARAFPRLNGADLLIRSRTIVLYLLLLCCERLKAHRAAEARARRGPVRHGAH